MLIDKRDHPGFGNLTTRPRDCYQIPKTLILALRDLGGKGLRSCHQIPETLILALRDRGGQGA